MKAFIALIHARNIEFIRDRAALGWSLLFPMLLTIAIALLFQNNDAEIYKVGVLGKATSAMVLSDIRYVQFIDYENKATAYSRISKHQLDMLISDEGYATNPENKNGYILEQLLLAKAPEMKNIQVPGRTYSHVEWYLPGILGMNIMFSSLYGVGYVVVRYRRTGVLKRMQVTPLSPWHFLYSQLFSRLITTLFSSSLIFMTLAVLFDVYVEGSLLLLLLSTALGTAAMISISLMITSRIRSDELSNGMLNFVSWPMMFLSGIWFSLEGSAPWVTFIADCLPLTHMNNINRSIISSGASFSSLYSELTILVAITVVCMSIAHFRFRWE